LVDRRAVTLLGVAWVAMRGSRDTVAAWPRAATTRGRLVYGVIEDAQGQLLLVYRDGEVRAVESGAPLLPPSSSSSDRFQGPAS
jgi:hypothetical protein